MNYSGTILVIAGLALCITSCNSSDKKQKDNGTDTSQTETANTKQQDNSGKFDINSVPVSDKELGEFPFFSLPKGVQEQNKAIKRSFDMLFFPVNGVMTPLEGKVWKSNIVETKDSEEGWSAVYFLKSYDDAITAAGGVKIFDGKISKEELDRIEEQATYFGEEGSMDYWNDPVKTYVIRRSNGDDVYIQLAANNAMGRLQILQKAPLKQTIVLLKSEQIQKDLNDKGKAILHINFDTDKATLKADGKEAVNEITKALMADKTLRITINGYTDNTGEEVHNLKLSKERAKAVKTELEKNGIDTKRLASEGFGAGNPIADNNSEEGKAQNRRVELVKNK
ncbi:MAG: OmpA family protein [Pedobacter sp.]|nr:MAG: OmpA family protein [Pedobacter sp.]